MTMESSIILSAIGIGVAVILATIGLIFRQINRNIASLERNQSEFREEMRSDRSKFRKEIQRISVSISAPSNKAMPDSDRRREWVWRSSVPAFARSSTTKIGRESQRDNGKSKGY